VLRRIAFADPGEGVDPAWSLRAIEESGQTIDSGVLEAAVAAVGPGEPAHDRTHVGLDE